MTDGGLSIFAAFFILVALATLLPYAFGIWATISIATTPQHFFGPWWDNTRTAWIVGVLVSFVIPFGGLAAAILWITTGRRGLKTYGVAGRPFWAGAPMPPPYWPGS